MGVGVGYTVDTGMIRVPSGTEKGGVKFHYTDRSGVQIKTNELFISEVFHVIVSDQG